MAFRLRNYKNSARALARSKSLLLNLLKKLSLKKRAAANKSFLQKQPSVHALNEQRTKKAFETARLKKAPATKELPVDFQLRQSGWPRKLFEYLFPVRHVFRLNFQYDAEFLDGFMPIARDSYIGRGSYKFVYKLPWQMVVKVSKEVWPGDPLFGSTFTEVIQQPQRFLKLAELALWEYLKRGLGSYGRERIDFKFHRLGMERYHYWKVSTALPKLALPTRFWMGALYRCKAGRRNSFSRQITPMDSQIMLAGKHLKEFARSGSEAQQSRWQRFFAPRFEFYFDSGLFQKTRKQALVSITQDIQHLLRFTEDLARREKLILDIHAENIIITLPDFQLRIFDFHLFDENLYTASLPTQTSIQEHIELIQKFVESFELERSK